MTDEDKEIVRLAFAQALRKRRIRKRLSQEELSHEGVARSHVSELESGRADPKLTTQLALSRILGIRFSIFMRDVERNYARLSKARSTLPPA